MNVFKAYGLITRIIIEEEGCVAFVYFDDVVDAFLAKMRLNMMKLVRDNATLQVKFSTKDDTISVHPSGESALQPEERK